MQARARRMREYALNRYLAKTCASRCTREVCFTHDGDEPSIYDSPLTFEIHLASSSQHVRT